MAHALNRRQVWADFSYHPEHFNTDLFMRIFKVIFDAIDRDPACTLQSVALDILRALRRP